MGTFPASKEVENEDEDDRGVPYTALYTYETPDLILQSLRDKKPLFLPVSTPG
jgi:hypothetical protein